MTLEAISPRSVREMYHPYPCLDVTKVLFHNLLPEYAAWQLRNSLRTAELYRDISVNNPVRSVKDSRRFVRSLKAHGVCVIPRGELKCLQTEKLIGEMLDTVSERSNELSRTVSSIRAGDLPRLVKLGFRHGFPVLPGIHLTDGIKDICWQYFNGPFRISRISEVALDAPHPGTIDKSRDTQLFHSDPDDFKILKFFLYLNNIPESSGPFEYALESHLQPYIRYFCPEEGCRLSDDQVRGLGFNDWLVCTGNAGTLIVSDTTGLHRGKTHVDGFRIRMQFMATSVLPLLETFESSSIVVRNS